MITRSANPFSPFYVVTAVVVVFVAFASLFISTLTINELIVMIKKLKSDYDLTSFRFGRVITYIYIVLGLSYFGTWIKKAVSYHKKAIQTKR